jgi:hypothetical protein
MAERQSDAPVLGSLSCPWRDMRTRRLLRGGCLRLPLEHITQGYDNLERTPWHRTGDEVAVRCELRILSPRRQRPRQLVNGTTKN